jgi:hypothetical protein
MGHTYLATGIAPTMLKPSFRFLPFDLIQSQAGRTPGCLRCGHRQPQFSLPTMAPPSVPFLQFCKDLDARLVNECHRFANDREECQSLNVLLRVN